MIFTLSLLLLLLHFLASSLPVKSAPIQIPLRTPSLHNTTVTETTTNIPPSNNITSTGNITTSHVPIIHDPYARLGSGAIYDICLSWKTISRQGDYSCRRIELDRVAAARITREQVARALLSDGGPLPVTVLLALSADQQGETVRPSLG